MSIKSKSTKFEKAVMGIGNVGSNLCWTFIAGFITMYYTNSVGVSATAAGTMMLVARVVDGVSDVIFGMVIEKVRFKMGKIRPWFIISGPLCGIGLWLCFHVPQSLGNYGKLAYVYITYIFVAAIGYTIFNLAYAGIIPLMSQDENDRNMIAMVQMLIVYIGVTVMYNVTPALLVLWGGFNQQGAWGKLTTIYAFLCAILTTSIGFLVKEKGGITEETGVTPSSEPKEKRSMKELLKELLTCRYTWILMFLFVFYYFSTGISGMTTYYWTYVFGSFELQGIAMTASMPLTVVALLLTPILLKKIPREKLVISGLILVCVSKAATIVFARNMLLFVVFNALSTLGLVPMMALTFTFSADLVDYFVRKGFRMEGLASSAFSIGIKVGTGLGSAVVGWGLGWFGFQPELEVQSMFTQNGIIFINSGIPLIMTVGMLICLKLWNIRTVE